MRWRDMLGLPALGVRARVDRALVAPISREVKERKLTYLPFRSLRNIEACLRAIRRRGVPGVCLEAGVALGGSGVVIARLMPPGAQFHGYDVFGMIPPPGPKDGERSHLRYEVIAAGASKGIRGETYYGYQGDLLEQVRATFASFGVPVDDRRVFLHEGLFEDTLDLTDTPVAFAHLDCDWYDPVKLCLERIYPALSPGGFVISDDYHTYDGAKAAVDEFLAEHRDVRRLEPRRPPDRTTNLVLVRSPDLRRSRIM